MKERISPCNLFQGFENVGLQIHESYAIIAMRSDFL